MAKSTKTKTASGAVGQLLDTGKLAQGDVTATYTAQGSDRVVIGFLGADDKGGWLRDICADAGLGLVLLTGADGSALTGPDMSRLVGALAKDKVCADAKSVSLCGTGPAGLAALVHAQSFVDPVVVAFDPTGDGGAVLHEQLMASAQKCRAATVFYDPFHNAQGDMRDAFSGKAIQWLKCFGLMDETLHRLWRMKHIPTMLPAALLGELDAGFFYRQTRNRKDFRFYRTGIEAALAARGKTQLQRRFRALFRTHMEAKDPQNQFARLQAAATLGRPANPDAWAIAGRGQVTAAAQNWPSVDGNIWMLEASEHALRYLSDRWHGVTMGYEERAGVTLAQTSGLALGMISFGQGAQVERTTDRRFPWHVVGTDLGGNAPLTAPLAEATLLCETQHRTHAALSTIMGFGHPAPGLTGAEAARGTPAYDAILEDVRKGAKALHTWDKTLHIDRVRLDLLSGAAQTPRTQAAQHYGKVAMDLCEDIKQITGQQSPPAIVVIQSAGSRGDGTSEVILAEGQFDLDNPALQAIVPSPAYPWPLMAGTPATHSAAASLVLDELSLRAVAAHQAGERWFCPYLRGAVLDGRTITADFASMAGLVLEDGPHGFHILSDAGPVAIAQVAVTSAAHVTITLAADPPDGDLTLAYAWGHTATAGAQDRTANHGALRDKWQEPSMALTGQTLRRFALAGRVAVQR